jgi:hypothetical protein
MKRLQSLFGRKSSMEANNALVKAIKEKRLADFKQQLDEIYDYVARTEEATDKALATVRDWNKDSEIQKLQQEVRELRSKVFDDFTISAEEHVEILNWQNEHMETKHKNKRYAPWSFEFTPTGLGLVGCCKCNECNEEFMFREP